MRGMLQGLPDAPITIAGLTEWMREVLDVFERL